MSESPLKIPQIPFTASQAKAIGLRKYDLKKLLLSGEIEKVYRGVYQKTDSPITDDGIESDYYLACLRCGTPSCINLISALDYYHLTDEIPNKTWIMVPDDKRVRAKDLRLIRSRDPHWDIGITKTKSYWITSLERTLIDCLIYKKIIGTQIGLSALKRAVTEKKVQLGDIVDLAKKMGVLHRVLPYIEILSA